MTARAYWCLGCGSRGPIADLKDNSCPSCGKIDRSRWLCCQCDTEGTGPRPDACPTCGCQDSWFQTGSGDPEPMREIFERVMRAALGRLH